MKQLISLFTALCLVLAMSGVVLAQDIKPSVDQYKGQGWKLKRSHKRSNTQVYLKSMEDSNIKSFLAVTEVQSDIPTIIALFNDVEGVPKWVHRIRSMKTLKQDSDTDMIQYSVTSTPPPAKDRDMLVHSWVERDEQTGVITIHTKGIIDDELKAPVRGKVRMTNVRTYWRLIPLDEKRTYVEFEGHGDPAGFLPVWLVNMVLHQSPYYTVKKMHRMLKMPEYKKAASQYQEFAYQPK